MAAIQPQRKRSTDRHGQKPRNHAKALRRADLQAVQNPVEANRQKRHMRRGAAAQHRTQVLTQPPALRWQGLTHPPEHLAADANAHQTEAHHQCLAMQHAIDCHDERGQQIEDGNGGIASVAETALIRLASNGPPAQPTRRRGDHHQVKQKCRGPRLAARQEKSGHGQCRCHHSQHGDQIGLATSAMQGRTFAREGCHPERQKSRCTRHAMHRK